MDHTGQLQQEYRETWQSFSRELDELQVLTGAPARDNPRIEDALSAVQTARRVHNDVRDRLAASYASSEINSTGAPQNTVPSLMTRA